MKNIDKCLIRMQKGDKASIEELYHITKKGVFAFVYSYLKNYHDAEDAMQTVYIKIQDGVKGYKAGTNARAWILQIAKNHCLNVIKKNQRQTPIETALDFVDIHSPFETNGITETMQRVLTEEERQIIILHVLWGYKHREIANLTDSATGTVTSKYKRAVDKLKKALKEESV